jgi:hypothetical protein
LKITIGITLKTWQKPNAQKLLPRKPENYNETGLSCKEFVPEGTTVTRKLYVEVPERTLTPILRGEAALPSEWQHVNNHLPRLPNFVPAELFLFPIVKP